MDQTPGPMISTRTDILGVPVDAVYMHSVLKNVHAMMATGRNHIIVAVNPEKVIAAQRKPDLLRAMQNATLVVPDGIGVVMAARILGKGSMERVAGVDLMPEICRLAAAQGHGIFLFGAKPEVVSRAALLLEDRFQGLKIAGIHHGYIHDQDMDQLIETINASAARVLFVGLGSPKQELWMDRYRERLNVSVCQGVGGSFDAICGYPKRAPRVLQKFHLEWLYRLISQPQRAWRQSALPLFVAQVLRQAIFRQR